MSNFSFPQIRKSRAKGHGRWKWAVFFSAAIAAVVWRTQTAISSVSRRSRGAIEEAARDIRSGDAAVADRQRTEESGSVIQAGEDNSGTFRPARVEPDAFGVVVTDDAPAGLEGGGHWVKGDGSATCPDAHPIKGNASSRIYHLPGEPSYTKTIPEICFATEEDAQAAGFRARAK